MDKEKLQSLIDNCFSIRDIANEVKKSPSSIRHWLKKFGLKTKGKRFNRGGNSKNHYNCKICGENDPARFYRVRGRCKNCHNQQQIEYVKNLKKKAVEYKGGCCQKCGYCANYAALDFHHLNPAEKDVNWKTARHWGWRRMKKELEKCLLVCRNCHAEIHHPFYQVEGDKND